MNLTTNSAKAAMKLVAGMIGITAVGIFTSTIVAVSSIIRSFHTVKNWLTACALPSVLSATCSPSMSRFPAVRRKGSFGRLT